MIHKCKPDVGNTKIFGGLAYAFAPKEIRKKWDSRSIKCLFMGYEPKSKGYRLYDIERNKIIISCDVKFNENILGENVNSLEQQTNLDENTINVSMESLNLNDPMHSKHESC